MAKGGYLPGLGFEETFLKNNARHMPALEAVAKKVGMPLEEAKRRMMDHAIKEAKKKANGGGSLMAYGSEKALPAEDGNASIAGKRINPVPLDPDAKLDLEKRTKENDGKPPEFITQNGQLYEIQKQHFPEVSEVERGVEITLQVNTNTPEDEAEAERVFKDKRYREANSTNLAQALSNTYPRMRSVLDQAKMFRFDQEATEKVVALSKEDWREWLPRAVNPFPITLFEFDSDHFKIILTKQSQEKMGADEMSLIGVTGCLIVGGNIIPLQKIMRQANPVLGFGYHPAVGKRLTGVTQGFDDTIPDTLAVTNNEGGMLDVLADLWGDRSYRDDAGVPEELEFYFLPEGAHAQMQFTDEANKLGIWNMAINTGSIRRALAAMALVNAEHPIIELGEPGGRSGRMLTKRGHVPRYSVGPVRIIPDKPRVRMAPAGEPDPDREVHHKAKHDVRAHSRTYHRGTEKEFTITVDAHQRGSEEHGDLTGPGRIYAVGETSPPRETYRPLTEEQFDAAFRGENVNPYADAVMITPYGGTSVIKEDGTVSNTFWRGEEERPPEPPVEEPSEDYGTKAALVLACVKPVKPRVIIRR